jgi:outer membrane protein OmpA-like peptidoglycan-associated protein
MRWLSFLFLLGICKHSTAQSLLVNGGFEEENICTEYQVNCAPEGWISTSSGFDNYFKEQGRAFEGFHCVAIEAGVTNKKFNRTYFRSRLLCGLRKGNKYLVEFYIKSPNPITDSAGIYFSHYDFLFEKKSKYLTTPSLYVADDPAFAMPGDSTWQKVSLVYTAKGDESFITLGNFSKKDINGKTGIEKENHFFVFIDNVSLTPVDPDEKICAGWQQTEKEIYAQNERHQYLQRLIKMHSNDPPEPPLLTKTTVLKRDTLLLQDLLFEPGKAALQLSGSSMLDNFCTTLQDKMIDSLVIEGYTDTSGTSELNEQLSKERAGNVAAYLARCVFIRKVNIITRGWGSAKPVDDNSTPRGRQKNRRVEIYLYTRESE